MKLGMAFMNKALIRHGHLHPMVRLDPWASMSPNPIMGNIYWPINGILGMDNCLASTLFPTTKTNNALDFFHAASHIRPHWCRVESDAVTYNLHIMIRYECEKALFTDDLDVKDLPAFWNQKMADYLRLDISNDAQGACRCSWSAGLFGYFPSYTLGTLIAAELYHVLETTIGNLDDVIRSGDFSPITLWLNQHIHFHGSKKTTDELLSDLNINITPSKFIELYAA